MGIARFFFRKRWEPPQQPRPKWLNVLLIIFVLYAVTAGTRKNSDGTPGELSENIDKVGEAMSKENLQRTYNRYRNILFPAYGSSLEIKDVSVGKGTPVLCGQEVSIAYATQLVGGRILPFKADKENPLTFHVGDGTAIPALEQGVTGMQLGGKRSLIASPGMSYGNKRFVVAEEPIHDTDRVHIDLELLSAKPKVPDINHSSYRISNVSGRGLGYNILCGQEAKVHVTMWDVEGKKIFSTKDSFSPITFTTGKGEVFLGLEQGVVGLPRKGKRTLVVPPEFQKTLTGAAPKVAFPFPKAQTVLVDVEALP